jgi:hypothetical protein
MPDNDLSGANEAKIVSGGYCEIKWEFGVI